MLCKLLVAKQAECEVVDDLLKQHAVLKLGPSILWLHAIRCVCRQWKSSVLAETEHGQKSTATLRRIQATMRWLAAFKAGCEIPSVATKCKFCPEASSRGTNKSC